MHLLLLMWNFLIHRITRAHDELGIIFAFAVIIFYAVAGFGIGPVARVAISGAFLFLEVSLHAVCDMIGCASVAWTESRVKLIS